MRRSHNSFEFGNVYVKTKYSICGKLEYEGPYGSYFNEHFEDLYFGQKSFEQAEMKMLKTCIDHCIENTKKSINYSILGDLNNQIAISNYTMKDYDISHIGIYSACATFAESIILGSILTDTSNDINVLCGSSSHNSTSERQFRNPNEYGGKKPDYFTFTATSAGAMVLSNEGILRVTKATLGKVIMFDETDANNLPRAMVPSCVNTIIEHLTNFNEPIENYDLVVTGDLSINGSKLLKEMLYKHGIDIYNKHFDCGENIFDIQNQEVYSGGSGSGCIAGLLNAYIIPKILDGTYHRVMVVATGALLNPVMCSQKLPIPAISHLFVLEGIRK